MFNRLLFVIGAATLTGSFVSSSVIYAQTLADAPKACQTDAIAQVVKDKDQADHFVLRLASGRSLRTLGQDFIDPRAWRKGDPVSICESDQGADVVKVTNGRRKEQLLTWSNASPR